MNPRLEFPPEEMRRMGYRVVDMIVEHLSTLGEQPVGAKGYPKELLTDVGEPPPEEGARFDDLLRDLQQRVLHNTMHVNHPRFFAYVPGPSNYVGALADAIISGYNVFAGTWIGGSGAAAVELETIDWLRQICGLPATAGGLFVSGGTMANLLGLAVARNRPPNPTIYFSDQTHSSLEKALRVLGVPPERVREIPSDDAYRLPLAALERAVAADRTANLHPFWVVANAGTTNTGAVDPLPELAAFCRREGLWLHVDGAYGAASAVCERGRAALRGMELADSLSLDPHKWLFQPFETGCLLVRDAAVLREMFNVHPEYLQDTQQHSDEVNFTEAGLQLTRSFRALKLWLSVKTFGMASFRAAIEHGFGLAELAESRLRAMPEWEVVTPAQMAIVCFRRRGADDAFHLKLVDLGVRDGYSLITSTVLKCGTVLRVCPINPRTTEADIEKSLDRLDRLARELKS